MATQQIQLADDALDGYDTGSAWDGRTQPYESRTYFIIKNTPGLHYEGGVRFLGVLPAQGSTINSATLTLTNRTTGASVTAITVYGDDVDDAPAWSGSSRPQSGFTQTTASAVVNSPTLTAGATNVFDVAGIIQEIVDRGSWSSGNSIRFSIVPTATYGELRITDYATTPSDTTADTAILDIDYTDGGGGPSVHQSIDPRKRGRIVYVR